MGGSGGGIVSLLKVIISNFDVLAGYLFSTYSFFLLFVFLPLVNS